MGVVGVGRGKSFMEGARDVVGMELVCVCDNWEKRHREVGERYGVVPYTDYDRFLEHNMDAVVLALCRTGEGSGKTYMLAENYPFTVFNQEMRRVYRTGEIGDFTYAEGEYNHPMSPR